MKIILTFIALLLMGTVYAQVSPTYIVGIRKDVTPGPHGQPRDMVQILTSDPSSTWVDVPEYDANQ